MHTHENWIDEVGLRIGQLDEQYGDYASTHEALGVLIEELDELRAAVRGNVVGVVGEEAMDIAVVALRLARQCRRAACDEVPGAFERRSIGA